MVEVWDKDGKDEDWICLMLGRVLEALPRGGSVSLVVMLDRRSEGEVARMYAEERRAGSGGLEEG